MTALIKTIIAAIIGMFGSFENAEMDQPTTEITKFQEQKAYSTFSIYAPFKCYHYPDNS